MTVHITVPLVNPNENEALLAALHVQEGQAVSAGDPLATLETTKSTFEMTAEADGYVVGLRVRQGQNVRAGEIFATLADTPHTAPLDPTPVSGRAPESSSPTSALDGVPLNSSSPAGGGLNRSTTSAHSSEGAANSGDAPPGLRITQPALELARRAGLSLDSLPQDRLLTESAVRAILASAQNKAPRPLESASAADPTAIIIYGGGGHAKALIDLIRTVGGYRIVGVLDDGLAAGSLSQSEALGVPILGGGELLPSLQQQGVALAVNAVGGIGSVQSRLAVFQKLAEAGFSCPTLVHPRAMVEASASLAAGVQVFPHAYVGSDAQVGFGCIINTGAIVSHDCRLGAVVNLSPGAILAGEVSIGDGALVGMGATVNLRVVIGAYARIGNSAVVKQSVPEKGIVKAGAVWPAS